MKVMWFGLLVVLYLMYIFMFLDLGCGLNVFHGPNVCTVFQIFLLSGPVYGIYLWTRRGEMVTLDYHVIYIPFVVWFTTFTIVGSKGMSNFLLESTIVALCLGLYLLRFPITRKWTTLAPNRLAFGLLIVISAGASSVALIVPSLAD